jgi:hypothetical protein
VDLIDAATGLVVQSTTSDTTATGNPSHNYVFPAVPVGKSYIVRVRKAGWRSAERTIVVAPDQPVDRVDFTLNPDFVFSGGQQMVSLPYEYGTQNAADVFGIARGAFQMAKFLPAQNRYAFYPDAPANQIHLGEGFFVKLPSPIAFINPGQEAPPGIFQKPLTPGWQIIGDPFLLAVSVNQIRVRLGDGTVLSMQAAFDRGVLLNDVIGWFGNGYTHNEQVLQPFRGYYVRAFQAVTLLIPDPRQGAAAGAVQRLTSCLPAAVGDLVAGELAAWAAPGQETARGARLAPAPRRRQPALARRLPAERWPRRT